ncbi:MAG: ABC transporter ATP-binding protein [Bryobacterales bacterium]|nr:ABC transporter ATP-binding protein [Bryobacterales bacterium]
MSYPLLEARITVRYGKQAVLPDLVLRVEDGEMVGLAGMSGSGKSSLALALMRLLHLRGGAVSGELRLRGRNLLTIPEREMRRVRGCEMALVLQSAQAALNPALTLDRQFQLVWEAHSRVRWREKRADVMRLLESFRLPPTPDFLRRLPDEISVGQAQRVLIAMAMLHKPALLVADEITSALDPLTEREVLEVLRNANREWGTAILFVSHNLHALVSLCHSLAVLHEGRIVERGSVAGILRAPRHGYTRQLLSTLPAVEPPSLATSVSRGAYLAQDQ